MSGFMLFRNSADHVEQVPVLLVVKGSEIILMYVEARSRRRASSSEDVTPFRFVCDAPNVIAPSESALTRNPEAPSLRNSTDRSPEMNYRRIQYPRS
jgi:hypothetical protein